MTGTYKEFYKFVQWMNPHICDLWEDFNNRPNPQIGDKFLLRKDPQLNESSYQEITFKKVFFDINFRNGVAFWYIFEDENGNEVRVYSINDVYEYDKLTIDDISHILGFWQYCTPIDKT